MGEGKKKRKMPKVTAARIMYIAAIQIVLTTIGFILYKRNRLKKFFHHDSNLGPLDL